VNLPLGYAYAATYAGIRQVEKEDLALIVTGMAANAAGVFTQNRVQAAPVRLSRRHLKLSKGLAGAIVVNAGNANCATRTGDAVALATCKAAGKLLRMPVAQVLPASTGVIGVELEAAKITSALPRLVAGLNPERFDEVSRAMMTTDLVPKTAFGEVKLRRGTVHIAGMTKGSGMIQPLMATTLGFVLTDAQIPGPGLRAILRRSVERSYNCLSVDGDTSTNDTVLLLASGESGARLKDAGVRKNFAAALLGVCQTLAGQIVADGEGVQHVIHLSIEQAKNRPEALRVAKAIAHSLLVKTAWAGADPNWGRILAAAGACGVPIRPERVEIAIGKQVVFRNGEAHRFDEAEAHRELALPSCDIRVKLGRGRSGVLFHTTDLTAEYVRINAEYST
jgi:glutamate N-acetyltransferase / amino-acid N-acetyltransferase